MIPLEDARNRILEALEPLPAESVALADALDRVPVAALHATIDLPPFDNSAVDGFALRSTDVAAATPEQPVPLHIAGVIAAGTVPLCEVSSGTCVRIFTGAVLPPGADAIVMQEDTRPAGTNSQDILHGVAPWEGVRFAGEDVRRGTCVVAEGERLGSARLALLAALGTSTVAVHRRPRLALLATGDELVAPGEPLSPGRIYESNRTLLAALARQAGSVVVQSVHVPDTLADTMVALDAATQTADVVVTTGGVSVGDTDHVKPAFAAMGGTVELWRLALKPGKPFAWGRRGAVHWFGLPGNPVSAYVTWHLLVRPALRRLLGERQVFGRRATARLMEPVSNRDRRRHFLRVCLEGDGGVRRSGVQASHILSSLAAANALLDVPPETNWPLGHEVQVELLD